MTKPNAVDAASPPTAAAAKAAGLEVVAAYIGLQAWKSVDAAYVKSLHAVNIGFAPLFEDQATNAKAGAKQGATDGALVKAELDALVAAVGYAPKNIVKVGAAVDFDTTPSEYPAIDAYLRAFDQANGDWGEVDYGEADLIDHEHSTGIDPFGFGTYAWSNGRVSAYSALQQYLNGQKLAGTTVDYDHLLNAAGLGVWWPPNHPLNVPGDDMTEAQFLAALIAALKSPTVQAELTQIVWADKEGTSTPWAVLTKMAAQMNTLASASGPSGTVKVTGELTLGG